MKLFVGVGRVSLYMRHARSLKDRRHVIKGIQQKLKNKGFSAVDYGPTDSYKQGSLGFCYAASTAQSVEHALDDALELFWGDHEITFKEKNVFELDSELSFQQDSILDEKYGDES